MRTERFLDNGDLWERIPVNRYRAYARVAGQTRSQPIRMSMVSNFRKLQRDAPDVVLDVWVINERTSEVYPLCAWCGVRPKAVDHDIEGAYYTSKCDSDQCHAVTLRVGRHKL